MGTPIKAELGEQNQDACGRGNVQGRDGDRRENCGEKPPNWRKLKRVLGQNRACR